MQISDSLFPVEGKEIYDHENKHLKNIRKLYETFDEKYDPSKNDAIRDAMIRAAVKIALVISLPKHWISGVAIGAGPIAEIVQKKVENIKCPAIDVELFHAMTMMPSCQESKEAVLYGLMLAKIPKMQQKQVLQLLQKQNENRN